MPNVPPWGEISTYISIACTGWEQSSEAYPDVKAPCPLVTFIKVNPAGSERVKGTENRSAGTPTLVTVQSAVTLFKFVTDKNDINEANVPKLGTFWPTFKQRFRFLSRRE